MQLFDCTIRLAGNVKMEVKKPRVPVSEIAVLQAIHGSDAVFNFKPAGEARVVGAREKERLMKIYGNRKEQAEKIEKMFPGLAPRLPSRLTELTGEEEVEDEAQEPQEPGVVDIPDEPAEGEEGEGGDVLDREDADFSFLNRTAEPAAEAALPQPAKRTGKKRGRRSNAEKAAEAAQQPAAAE